MFILRFRIFFIRILSFILIGISFCFCERKGTESALLSLLLNSLVTQGVNSSASFTSLDGGVATGVSNGNVSILNDSKPYIIEKDQTVFILLKVTDNSTSKSRIQIYYYNENEETPVLKDNSIDPIISNDLPLGGISDIYLTKFNEEILLTYRSSIRIDEVTVDVQVKLYTLTKSGETWSWTSIPSPNVTNMIQLSFATDSSGMYISSLYLDQDTLETGLQVYKAITLNSPTWNRIDGGTVGGLRTNASNRVSEVFNSIVNGFPVVSWKETGMYTGDVSWFVKKYNGTSWEDFTVGLVSAANGNTLRVVSACSNENQGRWIVQSSNENYPLYFGSNILEFFSAENIWKPIINPTKLLRYNTPSTPTEGYQPMAGPLDLSQSCANIGNRLYYTHAQKISNYIGWDAYVTDRVFLSVMNTDSSPAQSNFINRYSDGTYGIGYTPFQYHAEVPSLYALDNALVIAWVQIDKNNLNNITLRAVKYINAGDN